MSYTGTKGQSGKGVVLSIGSTPVAVGEIVSGPKQTGRKNNTIEATNLDSAAEEFIGTIPSSGSWEFEFTRVGSDAGQIAMEAAYASAATTPFTIQFVKRSDQSTTGDKFTFSAIVEQLNYAVDLKKPNSGSASLKVTGAVTFVAGS